MKKASRIGLIVAFLVAPAALGGAQSVELLFTPTVVQQAVALKSALRIPRFESSNALSLVGAPAERRKAYGDKVATATALIIVGEDALKAVADMEFASTVILINASGETAAKGRVVRVFDGANAPESAQAVSSASAVKGLLGAGNEVSFKGPAATVIQGVLDALK
jgi:hypothetical protein